VPHSSDFNARRRRLYREAVRRGLSPREAGHIYTDEMATRKIAAALREKPSLAPEVLKSPAERQLESGISTGHYIFHSDYGAYVRVRIRGHDFYSEQKVRKHYTVVFTAAEVPTRAAIAERVDELLRREPEVQSDRIIVDGFTVEEVQLAPDRTEPPPTVVVRPDFPPLRIE